MMAAHQGAIAYESPSSHQSVGRRRLVLGHHPRQPPPVQTSDQDGRVTVPGNMNDDLAPGTLNSILKQAGLKE